MDRQGQRLQAAKAEQQSACVQGESQACSDANASYQSAEQLYRAAGERYQRCRVAGGDTYQTQGNMGLRYGSGVWFDPLRFELEY